MIDITIHLQLHPKETLYPILYCVGYGNNYNNSSNKKHILLFINNTLLLGRVEIRGRNITQRGAHDEEEGYRHNFLPIMSHALMSCSIITMLLLCSAPELEFRKRSSSEN